MKDRKPIDKEISEESPAYDKKTYFIVGVVATVLSAVAFGLAFTVLGIYALIGSVLFSLAALSFLNTQKKKNDFKAVFYAKIAATAVLVVCLAFFIGGIIYAAL